MPALFERRELTAPELGAGVGGLERECLAERARSVTAATGRKVRERRFGRGDAAGIRRAERGWDEQRRGRLD